MDFTNELMSVVYGSNKLVANSTIQASFSVSLSISSIVSGESRPPCWQMKQIITINKLVELPEEGTSNSIVQQAPPINYYESDPKKPTITTFKKTDGCENASHC